MNPYRILTFDVVGSTNDEAMTRLKSGTPGGFIVVARRQTGGRGRQGRTWVSPPGNLYASLALEDPAPLALVPQLGFVAGVALHDVLRARIAHDGAVRIKWPNDIVVSGAKLAGILLESARRSDGRLISVVGIGVNCRSHPDELPYPASDLAEAGDPSPDADAVLAALASAFAATLAIWDRGAGFAQIRARWLEAAAGLGTRIRVAVTRGAIREGVFAGLDESGRLLLDTDTGRAVIDAGDVFLSGAVVDAI